MKLRTGVMKSQQLAQWFGVSYNTYRKDTKNRLEILKKYCKFEKVWGGIDIKQVYLDTYDKELTDKMINFLSDIIHNTNDGLSTFSGMTRKRFFDAGKNFTEKQFKKEYEEVRYYGNKGFGTLKRENKGKDNISKGLLGTKSYVWAVRDGWYNQYRELTDQEWAIFKECAEQTKEDFNIVKIIQNNTLLEKEEIDYKTFAEENYLTAYDSSIYFKTIFEEKTGLPLDYVQKHKVDQKWIEWEGKINEKIS